MAQSAVLPRCADLGRGCPPVLRLGLATRGNTHLEAADVAYAVRRGVNCLNWCGYDDGLARALHERLVDREQVVVAMQLESRDARSAAEDIERSLRTAGGDRLRVVPVYLVDREQ